MFRLGLIVGFVMALALPAQAQNDKISASAIQSLIRAQQYDQALDKLKVALRGNPDDFKLWTLEGICRALQGSDSQAIAAFDHAIRISPNYTPALKGEIEILYKTGDKRAIPLLERTLKSDPGDATGHEMLATSRSCDERIGKRFASGSVKSRGSLNRLKGNSCLFSARLRP